MNCYSKSTRHVIRIGFNQFYDLFALRTNALMDDNSDNMDGQMLQIKLTSTMKQIMLIRKRQVHVYSSSSIGTLVFGMKATLE